MIINKCNCFNARNFFFRGGRLWLLASAAKRPIYVTDCFIYVKFWKVTSFFQAFRVQMFSLRFISPCVLHAQPIPHCCSARLTAFLAHWMQCGSPVYAEISPSFCHFLLFRSRRSPQHPVLKYPGAVSFPYVRHYVKGWYMSLGRFFKKRERMHISKGKNEYFSLEIVFITWS